MLKQLKRTRAGMFIISWIAALVIALLLASVRWRRHAPEKLDAILADHQGFILVFWHERLLSMVFLWPRKHRLTALQSTHVDGRIIAGRIITYWRRRCWECIFRISPDQTS